MGRQESPQFIERKTQVDTDAQGTSRASKYIRNFSQNIRSGNTDAYHPRVHIRKVPVLWRINYTSIDTIDSLNAKFVSTLAEHGNTQLLLYMVVQTM